MLKNKRGLSYNLLKTLIVLIIISFSYVTAYADDRTLDEVRYLIKNYYYEEVPDNILNKTNIEDMIKALNDPYTEYFKKQEFNDFVNSVNMQVSGIGVHIEMVNEGVKVTSVIEGSPAEKAGILPGDIIIESDGHSLANISQDEAVKYVRGEEGSIANLKVNRDGKIRLWDFR